MISQGLLNRIPKKAWEEWAAIWDSNFIEESYDDYDEPETYFIVDAFCNKYWRLSNNKLGVYVGNKKGCPACPLDKIRQPGQDGYTCRDIVKTLTKNHMGGDMDIERISWYSDEYDYDEVAEDIDNMFYAINKQIETMGCHCGFEL